MNRPATTSSMTRLETVLSLWPGLCSGTRSCLGAKISPHMQGWLRDGQDPGRRGPGPDAAHLARKPALVISDLCSSAALATQVLYSSPDMKVLEKAPFAMKSFHSGVSRTFSKRPT